MPLYPKFPLIEIPGTYVSVRFEDFLLAVMAVFALIKIIPNIKNVFNDGITRAMAVFLLVGSVSLLAGVFLTQTVVFNIGILHLLRRVEYFVPFVAILTFFPYDKGKNLEFYIKILMLTVFIAFLYGVGQMYLNFPVIVTQNSESSKGVALSWVPGSQLTSTFAGHYDLAAFMVLVLPILICLIFTVKGRTTKIILSLASLAGFWLLANSASRISLVSYLLAVCVSLFLVKRIKAIFVVIIISLVLGGLSTNLFDRYKTLIDVYFQRMKNMMTTEVVKFDFKVSAQEVTSKNIVEVATPTPTPVPVVEDRSTSIRLNVEWPGAIRAFFKEPLIGTGYSSVGLAVDNDYLRLLAEVGILGFLGFALIITRILLTFASALPLTDKLTGVKLGFVTGVIGGTIGTLLNAVFIDVFEASKFAIMFWLLVGLAVYIVKDALYDYKI